MVEKQVILFKDVVDMRLLNEITSILSFKVEEDWQKFFNNNEQFKHLDYKTADKILDFGVMRFKRKFDILFRDLSDSFSSKVLVQSDSRLFLPGEIILIKGKHSTGIYLILKGDIYLAGPSITNPFRRIGVGSFFGETCITDERSNPFYYIAETQVDILFIKKEVFDDLLPSYPEDIRKIQALSYFRYKYFLFQMHNFAILHKTFQEKPTNSIQSNNLESIRFQNQEEFVDEEHSPLNIKEKSEIIQKENSKDWTKMMAEENPTNRNLDIVQNNLSSSNSKRNKPQTSEQTVASKNPSIPPKKRKTIWKESNIEIQKGFAKLIKLNESCIELGDNSTDSEDFKEGSFIDDEQIKESESIYMDDDDENEENDMLNSSDIYPLENPTTFSNSMDSESYINYLQERVKFIQEKLEKTKNRLRLETHSTILKQRNCNNKFFEIF